MSLKQCNPKSGQVVVQMGITPTYYICMMGAAASTESLLPILVSDELRVVRMREVTQPSSSAESEGPCLPLTYCRHGASPTSCVYRAVCWVYSVDKRSTKCIGCLKTRETCRDILCRRDTDIDRYKSQRSRHTSVKG